MSSNNPGGLRQRRVKVEEPLIKTRLAKQRQRIRKFQQRWQNISQDLPPQLSRRHIGMISIGGVIGTGLFLGSGDALYHGGPVGALLGYSVIGSVVYCLCVSVGEMISFLPNVGGVVGLANLYVDPALGFSLGWAAWYNWSVTLPTEITAASIVVGYWDTDHKIPQAALSAIFLLLAVGINCFPSRIYGEFEFWMSSMKVVFILAIIIISLLLDLGAGRQGFIGLKNWTEPFASNYLGIFGSLGRFLGFWAVLMQASFSFFGSEVPGIAAGEVIDASRNVPRALKRVWLRISLFYIGGIFCAGLLVPHEMIRPDDGTSRSSPFVIALESAGVKVLPDIFNAVILLSAWSAAASDVYISSRFLFFLARCHHAPAFLASLVKYPSPPSHMQVGTSDDEDGHSGDDFLSVIDITGAEPSQEPDPAYRLIPNRSIDFYAEHVLAEELPTHNTAVDFDNRQPFFVLPLASVIVSASVGLLTFLSGKGGPNVAFSWLVNVASVASLQAWAGLLFTYIRWHQGTIYAERQNKDNCQNDLSAQNVMEQIEKIKEQRHAGQPYLAWYAFGICITVLFTNGWSVFVHNSWKIAETCEETPSAYPEGAMEDQPISLFLSSYIPLPFFLLLTLGYKLIYQTKMIRLEDMSFSRENVPERVHIPSSKTAWGRFMKWLLMN